MIIEILSYITVSFAAVQALVALTNFVHGIALKNYENHSNKLISVLIPARNEEKNLKNIRNDLLNQTHKNLEIIIFNDESEDRTLEIATDFQQLDKRVKIINSVGLPEGWLGKNHACHRLGMAAKGDFLLFLDADVRLTPEIISRYVSRAQRNNLDLISIFPRQIMKTFGEFLTVPLMNHILLSLLPLPLVRHSMRTSLSAANGQFMLFETAKYKLLTPHQTLRKEKVEDILIAQLYKMNKNKVECLASESGVSCRMYSSFGESLQGFSKNVIHYFGNSIALSSLFWIFSFPAVIFTIIYGNAETIILLSISLITSRILNSATSHQNALFNIILFGFHQIVLPILLVISVYNRVNNSFVWKGRNIS
ncbi:MAG: glycosyltransferase family 2 protein [Bacteroidales bacterium]|nr:glycosyltransferase family 2 protein [Bacteroidales bacterium]